MVGLLLPSDFLGRPGRNRAPFDVTAISNLTLCCFRRRPFEEMMAVTPHVADRLLDMTLDELDAARDWMMVLGRKGARERIASLLCILAHREAALGNRAGAGPLLIDIPLTRELMADCLGLTLETVSRQMSALKADGVIELETARRVRVPDLRRLESEADGEGSQ
jgi:CRP/FNR family transcriptional regulator